jgi:hypothetical protein
MRARRTDETCGPPTGTTTSIPVPVDLRKAASFTQCSGQYARPWAFGKQELLNPDIPGQPDKDLQYRMMPTRSGAIQTFGSHVYPLTKCRNRHHAAMPRPRWASAYKFRIVGSVRRVTNGPDAPSSGGENKQFLAQHPPDYAPASNLTGSAALGAGSRVALAARSAASAVVQRHLLVAGVRVRSKLVTIKVSGCHQIPVIRSRG